MLLVRLATLKVGNGVNGLIYLGFFHFFDEYKNDKGSIILLIKYGYR
jgi:3-hydroxy-3-methylglutaryl CoA synthase